MNKINEKNKKIFSKNNLKLISNLEQICIQYNEAFVELE